MRYIPYVMAASMAAPLVIWAVIAASLPGTTTYFWGQNLHELILLVPLATIAIGLMAWWMSRLIAISEDKAKRQPAE